MNGVEKKSGVLPTWGKKPGLEDGQVVNFSAPAGGQTTDDPRTNFCLTGYELYVTVDGVERLAEKKKDAVAGRYAHAEGQSARLVWFTRDMPLVAVDAGEGGTCFVAGSWQHVALVYDRDSQKVTCYRNYGAGAEKSLVIAETTDNVKFCLGSQHLKSDSNFFNGWISCLRLTKGALTPREFMRADVSDDADGTIALWDFRGKAGTTVGALKAMAGDRELFKASAASADPEKAPRFSDDLPGAAIYAGAAAMEAHQPLSKRVGAIAFTGTTDDYLAFPNLSTAVSDCDEFTLEFFEKCESTSTWKAAISWNDAWIGGTSKPFEVQIPGLNAKSMRIQCNFRGDSADLTKTANLSDGKWHHVAVTYTKADDKYTLWYDREKGPSITSRGLHQHTAAPLILGTVAANTGAELFVGKLSCLRVSSRALDPSEFLVAGPKPPSGLSILVR